MNVSIQPMCASSQVWQHSTPAHVPRRSQKPLEQGRNPTHPHPCPLTRYATKICIYACAYIIHNIVCWLQVMLVRRSAVVDDKLEDEMAGLQVTRTSHYTCNPIPFSPHPCVRSSTHPSPIRSCHTPPMLSQQLLSIQQIHEDQKHLTALTKLVDTEMLTSQLTALEVSAYVLCVCTHSVVIRNRYTRLCVQ